MGIGVLGPACIEGASLGGRDRKVLAVLVLNGPQWIGAERSADALWGEDPPASRAKVVQGAVSRLRRALWPDAIVSGPGGYRLDVPPDVIDARRFERLVERAERAVETDPSAAIRCLEEAESLWRGRPFADLGDWDQALGTISRLEERRRLLDAAVLPSLIDAIDQAIDLGRNGLGPGYELAARRGEQMTGDELLEYARHAVSELTGPAQHLTRY